jgi:hypothetical protein
LVARLACRGRNFRSPKTSQGLDTCKRPGAGPRLPLTPIKPSSPLSQDHQDLPDFRSVATEVVIQGWQLCARVSRFASGQEFGMKRSRRRDERRAATALARAAVARRRRKNVKRAKIIARRAIGGARPSAAASWGARCRNARHVGAM